MSSGASGGTMASSVPFSTARSSAAHSTSSSRVRGKRRPFGRAAAAVAGAADALEERGDAAGRADLADQVDRADVDSQLQRRGGHQRLQVAGPQAGLDLVAPVLRQGAVVGADDVVAEAFAELVGQALGQAAGVDEHQRRVMLPHQVGDPVEDVAHLLAGGDRLQLALRQLEGQVEVTAVPGVDDGAAARGPPCRTASRPGARSAAAWPTARSAADGPRPPAPAAPA